MLEETGEPYQTVWLDYATSMRAPDYLRINPMGKVPTIVHDEVVITETAAIVTYLADRFPAASLIPAAGSGQRGTFYRWLFFAAGPLEQAVTARSQKWTVTPEQEGMVGFGTYERTLATLETALKPGPYICGQQFTAADVYVGSQLHWGMLFGTIGKKPLFEDYVARLHDRPASQRANTLNEAYLMQQADPGKAD